MTPFAKPEKYTAYCIVARRWSSYDHHEQHADVSIVDLHGFVTDRHGQTDTGQ